MLINGEAASVIAVSDRGFQYGDGVFSTMPVVAGKPLWLKRHLDRLERDCSRLAIPFPGRETLIEDTASLLRGYAGDGIIKIQITRGSGGRGYRPPDPAVPTRIVALHPPAAYPPEYRSEGIEARWCDTRLGQNPVLAGIKHMNRLEQILARNEWRQDSIAEGLMLDNEGHVIEGTMTNLFIIRGGLLATPRLDLCGVSGVMRQLVMEGFAALGWLVEEKRLRPVDVETADHLFLTNSVMGIWPVRRLGQRDYPMGHHIPEIAEWLTTTLQSELPQTPLPK